MRIHISHRWTLGITQDYTFLCIFKLNVNVIHALVVPAELNFMNQLLPSALGQVHIESNVGFGFFLRRVN